jgi:D-alanyl-D-alanine carboxypeptidase
VKAAVLASATTQTPARETVPAVVAAVPAAAAPAIVVAASAVAPAPAIAAAPAPQILAISASAPAVVQTAVASVSLSLPAPAVASAAVKALPLTKVVIPTPKPVLVASAEPPKAFRIPFALATGSIQKGGIVLASATKSEPVAVSPAAQPADKPTSPKVMQSDISGLSLAFASKSANPPAAKRWAVQIGAFNSESLAKTKLAAYAKSSAGAVAQAEQIVTSFTAFDGRTLYRARFGSFAQNQARDICNGMVKRGETCFATAQSN